MKRRTIETFLFSLSDIGLHCTLAIKGNSNYAFAIHFKSLNCCYNFTLMDKVDEVKIIYIC